MDALFVIPTLVSNKIGNPKLIPALGKLVEQNIAILYYNAFKSGAMYKYRNNTDQGLMVENTDYTLNKLSNLISLLTEGRPVSSNQSSSNRSQQANVSQKNVSGGGEKKDEPLPPIYSRDYEQWKGDPLYHDKDKVESPKGVMFYSNIGMEPTIVEFPIVGSASGTGSNSPNKTVGRLVRIGIKSIQYYVPDTINLRDALLSAKYRTRLEAIVTRKILNVMRSLKSIITKNIDPEKFIKDILINQRLKNLENPRYISQAISSHQSLLFSTLTIFSKDDFPTNEDYMDTYLKYNQMVKGGWGDMIILDETKETLDLCMMKSGMCQHLPLEYLKQLLTLDKVMDYREISRWSRPMMKLKSIQSVLENTDISDCISCKNIDKNKLVNRAISNIIREHNMELQ